MLAEGKTPKAARAWVLKGYDVRMHGMTARTCAWVWGAATWCAARGRLGARVLCGRGAQGGGEAEGPRHRVGPQRRFHSLRKPALTQLDVWQDGAGARSHSSAAWTSLSLVFKSIYASKKMHNFRNCQRSEKSPKLKVVEEL
jgi:hypothetical protein